MVWVCRDAVSRIINLTESTIASGDDEGCVKVINLSSILATFACFLDYYYLFMLEISKGAKD